MQSGQTRRDGVTLYLLREGLKRGQTVRLRVYGDSMQPTLLDGDQVEVRPLVAPPTTGEVVACAVGERLIVHRVLRADPAGNVSQPSKM